MKVPPSKPLIKRIDREVELDADGHVDAGATAKANWHAAKGDLMIAAGTTALTLVAAAEIALNPFDLFAPKIVAGGIGAISATATACFLGAALKDTAEAAVWGVIAGATGLYNAATK